MKVVVIFMVVAPGLSFQHSHSDTCSDENDTGHSALHFRRDNSRHGSHSDSLESSNDQFIKTHSNRQYLKPRRREKKKSKRYDCVCDCGECEKLPKCCHLVCDKECDKTEENSVESDPGPGSGNMVVVPYPYPLVVPGPMPLPPPPPVQNNNDNNNNTSSINNNTTSAPNKKLCGHLSKCSSRKQSDLQDDPVLDLLQILRRRQELPRLNLRPVKNTQIPDYEEIDDQLLDRLIRLRHVKNINS